MVWRTIKIKVSSRDRCPDFSLCLQRSIKSQAHSQPTARWAQLLMYKLTPSEGSSDTMWDVMWLLGWRCFKSRLCDSASPGVPHSVSLLREHSEVTDWLTNLWVAATETSISLPKSRWKEDSKSMETGFHLRCPDVEGVTGWVREQGNSSWSAEWMPRKFHALGKICLGKIY